MAKFIGLCAACGGKAYQEGKIIVCSGCNTNWNAEERDKITQQDLYDMEVASEMD